ncbi:MAG: Murein DD-endopeptidase MepM [Pelotomaculum sp. PtaU1.Bin035]|nr:MAG: Murein DD-endopeptidase MepM [Pelotomaculum sp. PtaU1.Bin035]
MKPKTFAVILSVLAVLWAAVPAVARLDERVLESAPYEAPPAAVAAAPHNLYEVKSGDTLSDIAGRSGVSIETLVAVNGLADRDNIRAGQLLKVPADCAAHLVQPGETLSEIAMMYRVDAGVIASRNGLADINNIIAGRQLLIPRGVTGLEDALPAIGPAIRQLAWPLAGEITSPFGLRDGGRHEGIDIAAVEGTPIRPAAPGKVAFAGPRGTYGLAVIIDHGGGTSTLYAHCSKVLVTEGDAVNTDTVIALSGNTGHSTGPHLHLEVLQNGVPLDPLTFLKRESYYG